MISVIGRTRATAGRGNDQQRQIAGIESDLGDEGALEHLCPIRLGQEGRGDIGEEGEAQPFEDVGYQPVASHDQEAHYDQRDRQNQGDSRQREYQVHTGRDGPNVGPDVDDIADHQGDDRRVEDLPGIVALQYPREPHSGYHSDLGADVLHSGHHRKGE